MIMFVEFTANGSGAVVFIRVDQIAAFGDNLIVCVDHKQFYVEQKAYEIHERIETQLKGYPV